MSNNILQLQTEYYNVKEEVSPTRRAEILQVIADSVTSERIWNDVREFLRGQKLYGALEAITTRLIKDNLAESHQPFLELAELCSSGGRFIEAKRSLDLMVLRIGISEDIRWNLADHYLQARAPDRVIPICTHALSVDPSNFNWNAVYCRATYGIGDQRTGRHQLKNLIKVAKSIGEKLWCAAIAEEFLEAKIALSVAISIVDVMESSETPTRIPVSLAYLLNRVGLRDRCILLLLRCPPSVYTKEEDLGFFFKFSFDAGKFDLALAFGRELLSRQYDAEVAAKVRDLENAQSAFADWTLFNQLKS